MNDMIQTGFDYAALPVDLAISLKLHEDRFIAVRNRATYEMGKEIYEAQKELANYKNGSFQSWVEHLGISYQTGYDLITIYQNAGSDIIKLFDNKKINQTVAVMLLRSPESVAEKAIEKAEAGEKVTVADVKDWRAEEARWKATVAYHKKIAESTEHELALERQRSMEWKDQWKAERDKKPERIEVIPPDYETAKARSAQLERELAKIKNEQATLINNQVKAKLHEYQSEVDEMEQRKAMLQEQVDRMKEYMASLESDAKRSEVHQSVINGVRLELINLAAFLSDEEPIQDADTLKRWRALSDMLSEAAAATRQYAGHAKPAMTVIRGDVA